VLCSTSSLGADDELVAAAKKAKEKKKSSTTRVLTNADAKKAKGVLIENRSPQKPADPLKETLAEKQARIRAARELLQSRIALLQSDTGRLGAELVDIERRYYQENDLDYRDRVLVKRFNQTRASHDRAAAELQALEEELAALEGTPARDGVPAQP
jgi:hypothetical protein